MNSERWERIEELFHAALELDPDQRVSYLRAACDDDEILSEVETLLAYDDDDERFMESPAIEVAARELAIDQRHEREIPTQSMSSPNSGDTPADIEVEFDTLAPGRIIGNYKIVSKIGAGGMGEVYLAEDQKLQRRVAIKLLPSVLGVASEFVQRFHREARAASALNHPNIVTIYSIDDADGLNFIEMEYVEGVTLKEKLSDGPLPLAEALELGRQIATGMEVAHDAGIIHRDLKPGNLLVTPAGQVKIVDFGLAKMLQDSVIADAHHDQPSHSDRRSIDALSQAGSISGTIPYMSPEQTRGMDLDPRTDLFSLGCVLYESLTGIRPFQGASSRDIIDEILTKEPIAPSQHQRNVPSDVDRIVKKALAKDRTQRYQSAAELEDDLIRAIRRRSFRHTAKRLSLPILALLLAGGLIGLWMSRREANRNWALNQLPEIQRLLDEKDYFAAHDLAEQVARYIPGHESLGKTTQLRITDTLTIITDPPGAVAYLQRYQKNEAGQFPSRQKIGVTLIEQMIVPRGDYLLTLEKQGYETFQRTMCSAFHRSERGFWVQGALLHAELDQDTQGSYKLDADSIAPIVLEIKLFRTELVPEGMVFVPGGRYRVVGASRVMTEPADLDDYWIDRCEVTNREFKEFVDAGGYKTREFWAETFLDQRPRNDSEVSTEELQELNWEEALQNFKDLTGFPGPAGWSNQSYPEGEADHPVTGVSWYEADAYARFRGKQLPTVYQWEKAARDGAWSRLWGRINPWGYNQIREDLTDRANVNNVGTVSVGRYPFGMSPFGCYDMSGNATEWCLNPRSRGFATMGGSWRDGPHFFGLCGDYPGLFRAETIGFRCVRLVSPTANDQGSMKMPDVAELIDYHPVSGDVYELFKRHYEYDHEPLREEIVERIETADWTRIKIRYDGAKAQNNDRKLLPKEQALAYLWLPKCAEPPYQVIFYKPGAASYEGLTAPQETEVVCGPFLKAGRAVFEVVIEGMSERPLPHDWEYPKIETVAYRDNLVNDVLDQRIGLDLLLKNYEEEIDKDHIACMALSMGGYDLVMLAVEERFKAHFLLSAGIIPHDGQNAIAEANPVNFAPYISGPKLMIHGHYDEGLPLETSGKPLFDLLSDKKELHIIESGHFPPIGEWFPIAQRWFDEKLDPVKLKPTR